MIIVFIVNVILIMIIIYAIKKSHLFSTTNSVASLNCILLTILHHLLIIERMKVLKGMVLCLTILCICVIIILMNTSSSSVTSASVKMSEKQYKTANGHSDMLNDSTVSIVDAKYAHMKYGTTLVAAQTNIPQSHSSHHVSNYTFTAQDLHRHYAFSPDSAHDVLVFIHMQKTGGTTFGKNLVKNLDLKTPCKCKKNPKLRCSCYNSGGDRQWLFSRYSTGWMCGLHADFTEWTECLADGEADRLEGFTETEGGDDDT
ncbi:HS6ST1 [Bugula neritina]|uniref:Heparan-sulfate 6-O-sulfotransferase n=1 Tax=Bugula neritina TaxID=10212 RepID=A0A7J7JIB9_BUGNE|nr:HS6ST1 [Bugula neritina]